MAGILQAKKAGYLLDIEGFWRCDKFLVRAVNDTWEKMPKIFLRHSLLLLLGHILALRCARVLLSLPAAAQGPVEGDDGQELVGPVLG